MKDAYSFDRDEDGVKRSFEANREAYKKIFVRCGLETYDVLAESGIMGGKFSVDFLAPSGSGENVLVRCENGDYAADGDIAEAVTRAPAFPETLGAPDEVSTPGVTTCEALADFLDIDVAATSKAMPVTKPDGSVVLALVRGDDRLSEMKLYDAIPGDSRPSTDDEIRAAFGAGGGSLGPGRLRGRGDRRRDAARRAVRRRREPRRLPSPRRRGGSRLRAALRRPPRAAGGRPMPGRRRPLRFQTAIEVGHIFNFGSFYSTPLGATFLDEDGAEKALARRQLRHRAGRVMAAIDRAAARRARDHLAARGRAVRRARRGAARRRGASPSRPRRRLPLQGSTCCWMIETMRAGEKFADADLIGCPIRVTAGKKSLEDGKVDFKNRATGEELRLDVAELGKEIGYGAPAAIQ